MLTALHAGPALAVLPVPTSCQADLDGANDDPGQKDITQFCVDPGAGTPFELHTSASLDIIGLSGSNTADVCTLFDSDGDSMANFAVCTTLGSNPAVLNRVRLFSCTDTANDKCTGSVQINVCTGGATCLSTAQCPLGQTCAQTFDTACEVSQQPSDPFPAGDSYPLDSVAVCALDLNEFGVGASDARILDACSYPSSIPNSDPSDCILYQECTTVAECNDGNFCTIDSCQSSTCVHTPDTGAICDDGDLCTSNTTCNDQGFCTDGAATGCDDGNSCTTDTCDPINGCLFAPLGNGTGCDDGEFCTTGDICTAGVCDGTPQSCTDGISCTLDSCDEGANQCVHTPNNGSCGNGAFCDGVEVCNPATGCQAGPPVICNDGISCTLDTCNEATDQCDEVANHGACNDFLYCNGIESCDVLNGCESGSPVNCSDGVGCTSDSCDEMVDQCAHVPNHASCTNGTICDGQEICDPVNDCEAGPPIDCGDGVACTVDSCNEGADACVHAPNNAACSNGQFCDGTEVCHATNDCQPGTSPNCNDGVSCTGDSCNEVTDQCDHLANDVICSNGQFCDGAEVCDPLDDCEPGTPPNCNDGVSCTGDSCNEATDQCDHAPNDAVCVNGQFCDGDETCDPVNDCEPGSDPCDPMACSEVLDQCVTCRTDAQCNDGLFCNGSETCNAGTGMCNPGVSVSCNDGIACTTDACNESSDSCVAPPNNALCTNGLFCDGVEVCNPLTGCQAVAPVACSDGVVCTVDSCSEALDQCIVTPNHAVCSDGVFCNGAEVCNPVVGCNPGTTVNCGDGVSCTTNACDETLNQCTFTPNDTVCSDGQFCNGAEVCDPLDNCEASTPIECGDGVVCTSDTCNEMSDACESTPDHVACGNGFYCDGNEICDPDLGCVPGASVDCSDDNACTIDTCEESSDMCAFEDICCGNGSIDIGEACDHGNLVTELCDNLIDDDEDGFFDCADPECRVVHCGANCGFAPPCQCIEEDPAVVLLSKTPNFWRLHGRILGDPSTIDPQAEGVLLQLSNDGTNIYTAELPPNSFVSSSPKRFRYSDKTASSGVDPVGPAAGLYQLSMGFREIDGLSWLTFKIKAYGDFTEATESCMTSQITIGDDLAALRADWTLRKAGAWWLRPGGYLCPGGCAGDPP